MKKKYTTIAGIILGILGLTTSLSAGNYRHIPNAAISGHNTKHLSQASVQDCMVACDHESWCQSFDYYKGKSQCDLSNKTADEVGGLKTNYGGDPYDHYTKQHSSPPVTVHTGYRHIPNAAISGHNTKHLSQASVQDCMAACNHESWCQSFDYYKGKSQCDLSKKTADEVGGLKTNYGGNPYDHYEKNK